MLSLDNCHDYLQCSYNNWCSEFQNYVNEHVVIPVPDDVLLYLMSDVMVLPKNSVVSPRSNNESSIIWGTTEEELEEPNFFDFDEKLKEAIQYLGGKVFIKLNWSAPKDASWITSTRSLCCSDPADIYLLLKSSSYISDDLSILKKCSESRQEVPCCLVLKKWEEIHPGTEFRCFVLNQNLVGISQRDVTSYFKFISDYKKSISESIADFFMSHVKSKISLDSYHFDLVIGPGKKIILIDIGVLNEKNNCLMFSWKELEEKKMCKQSNGANSEGEHPSYGEEQNSVRESSSLEPEFRYIDEFTNVTQNPCKHFGIPVDALHFCSGEKNVADYVQDEILNNRL